MSTQITTAFVNQFHRNFELLLQQEGSRLRPYVDVVRQNGEYGYYDYIGAVSAQTLSSRHADTSYVTTPHSRRRIGLGTYFVSDLIDKPDKVKMLGDPTNDYAMNFAHAIGRKIDELVVSAAFGTAYAGKDGSTSITWAASGTTYTESASAGLSLAKLRWASKQLNLKHVPKSDRIFVCTANQIDDLLGISEVTSSDYNTVRTLMDGDVKTFLGFKFVTIDDDILSTTGSNRRCFAFDKRALKLAIGMDAFSRITEMPTKHYSTQVYTQITAGAARMQEDRMVEVQCFESS